MQASNLLCFIACAFPIKILLDLLFAFKTRRPYSLISLSNKNLNVLDISIFIVFLIRLIREFTKYRNGLSQYETGSA